MGEEKGSGGPGVFAYICVRVHFARLEGVGGR